MRLSTPPRHPVRALSGLAIASAVLLMGVTASGASPAQAERDRPVLVRRVGSIPTPTREDTARALHLLERATFGATREDLAEVLRIGREAWIDRQLHPERIPDPSIGGRLAAFPAASMSVAALYAAYPPPQPDPAQRARRDSLRDARESMQGEMAGDDEAMRPQSPDARERRQGARGPQGPQRILFDLAGARVQRAAYSERQLEEVMTDFWFNHFNVFFGKNQDRWLVGDYERDAIRPHVFGRFRDLLEATASHPAMLVYLDNWQSASVDSAAAGRLSDARRRWRTMTPEQRRRAVDSGRVPPEAARMLEMADGAPAQRQPRARGLNENYARELLELHTLGVDGGYTQADVVAVARAFTGWTMDRPRPRDGDGPEPGFVFRPAMHDRGEKTVLGRRLPAGRGVEDGREVLDMLARHPSTARHVARKLAQRFVADDPPPALVDRLAAVFQQTDGDLRAVTRALLLSPEMDDARYRQAKVKTPLEFVASALRASGADAGPSRGVLQTLRQMGQVPYAASAPTGYPHTSEEWTNGGAMLNRMNFALALASGRVDGVSVDPARLVPAGSDGSTVDGVRALAAAVLPGRADESLVQTIAADVDGQASLAPRQKAARALGLLLGSPAFQRR